jgi:DNA polymerase I-like protein with 3'-5' exonuclease and polymerase domains
MHPVRKVYSSLNTLLQSAGAIVMKKALIILDEDLQNAGLVPGVDYEFVANVHDEFQIEVVEDKAKFVGESARKAIQKAGEALGFNCPLDGEFAIGSSWADTH